MGTFTLGRNMSFVDLRRGLHRAGLGGVKLRVKKIRKRNRIQYVFYQKGTSAESGLRMKNNPFSRLSHWCTRNKRRTTNIIEALVSVGITKGDGKSFFAQPKKGSRKNFVSDITKKRAFFLYGLNGRSRVDSSITSDGFYPVQKIGFTFHMLVNNHHSASLGFTPYQENGAFGTVYFPRNGFVYKKIAHKILAGEAKGKDFLPVDRKITNLARSARLLNFLNRGKKAWGKGASLVCTAEGGILLKSPQIIGRGIPIGDLNQLPLIKSKRILVDSWR